MSIKRVAAIAGSFIRIEPRDPIEIVMMAIVPLFMAFIFGFADERANASLPIGLLRIDNSAPADELVDRLDEEQVLRVREFSSRLDLEEALGRGEVYAGIVIPEGFGDDITTGTGSQVEIIGDDSRGVFVAANAALTLAVDVENQLITVASETGRPSDEIRDELRASPVEVERVTASKSTEATGFGRLTAGMLLFFLFEHAMYQSYLLVEDRRRGVVARMATTHSRDSDIVAGLILGRFAFQIVQALIIIGSAALLFGIRWGAPLAVAAIVVLFAAVATSISVIVGSRRRALNDVVFARVGLDALLGLLGGCFFSLLLLPDWVRMAGHIGPHAWAMDALDELLASSAGVVDVLPEILVLTGMAVACFLFAIRRMRAAVHG